MRTGVSHTNHALSELSAAVDQGASQPWFTGVQERSPYFTEARRGSPLGGTQGRPLTGGRIVHHQEEEAPSGGTQPRVPSEVGGDAGTAGDRGARNCQHHESHPAGHPHTDNEAGAAESGG